jgi:CRP-like cAMP-binding protein
MPLSRTIPGELNDRSTDIGDIQALRASAVLSHLSQMNLDRIASCGTLQQFNAKACIFETGTLAKAMYVIRSGSVELIRPDDSGGAPTVQTRLKAGDLMCDVGVFSGVRHRSTARVLETAAVMVIPWQKVKMKFREHPDLAYQVCAALAHCLTATRTLLEAAKGRSAALQGSLAAMDLTTVVQTFSVCEELSGRLVINGESHEYLGEVVIERGQAIAARREPFQGDDAFVALLVDCPPKGTFFFFECDEEMQVDERDRLKVATHALLMDVARQGDELRRFREEVFPEEGALLVPKSRKLVWCETNARLALKVWEQLQEEVTVGEVVRGLDASQQLGVYNVLLSLMESEQLTVRSPNSIPGLENLPPRR